MGDSGSVVLGEEMGWKEAREKSLKNWGGGVMSWLYTASEISRNGHEEGA